MQNIRWGILGTAEINRRALVHAFQHANGGELSAIASRDLDKATAFAKEYNIPRAYGSYDELLADPDIDAIYNPLPNHLHGVWSINAAEAGKAVLCEKPLAQDAPEAQQMLDTFKNRGVLLAEAFMYRYHPQIERILSLIAEGAIGNIKVIDAGFTYLMSPEQHAFDIRTQPNMAGGALMDVGCYCVSMMRLVTGEEPIHATADAIWAESGTDDTLVGTLRFPSGVLGHFDCGFLANFRNFVEVRGDGGRLFAGMPFTSPRDEEKTIHVWRDQEHEELHIAPTDHYRLMVEDFQDALREGRPTRWPAKDAVNQMRAIDMLYASARENK